MQGKVRDIYDYGDRLLIVATDRISAFDYVLGSGIPDKGKVLTQISSFWFDRTRSNWVWIPTFTKKRTCISTFPPVPSLRTVRRPA